MTESEDLPQQPTHPIAHLERAAAGLLALHGLRLRVTQNYLTWGDSKASAIAVDPSNFDKEISLVLNCGEDGCQFWFRVLNAIRDRYFGESDLEPGQDAVLVTAPKMTFGTLPKD